MQTLEELMAGVQLTNCARCGRLCKVADKASNPDARLVALAKAPEGLCVDCAFTQFLRSVETIAYGIEQRGVGILLDPLLQRQLAELLIVGNSDARPELLNWRNIVEHWADPFPKRRRARRRKE